MRALLRRGSCFLIVALHVRQRRGGAILEGIIRSNFETTLKSSDNGVGQCSGRLRALFSASVTNAVGPEHTLEFHEVAVAVVALRSWGCREDDYNAHNSYGILKLGSASFYDKNVPVYRPRFNSFPLYFPSL